MDRLDHRVRSVQLSEGRRRDTARRSTVALEFGPDAGEGGQRLIVVEAEPDDVFLL